MELAKEQQQQFKEEGAKEPRKAQNSAGNRRFRGWLILAGVLLLAGALIGAMLPPHIIRLHDRATRIVPNGYSDWAAPYFWVSDRQVLLLCSRYVSNKMEKNVYLAEPNKQPIVLQPFTRRYREALAPIGSTLSPDGRWLVWKDTASAYRDFVVASLDGKETFRRKGDPSYAMLGNRTFWLPDGSHWVEVVGKYDSITRSFKIQAARIYDLHSPQVRVVRIPGNLAYHEFLGVTSAGRLLLHDRNTLQTRLSLLECSLDTPVAAMRRFVLPMPNVTWQWDVAFTPEGDRLALVLSRYHPLRGSPFLLNVQKRLGLRGYAEQGIWVTRLQGGGLHLVGLADLGKDSSR